MATIKRNGNLVVLKGGKVSCTCCGEECCMYPAQGIQDGLYSIDDLPDQINLYLDVPGASPVYFKLAAPTQSIFGTAYYIGSNSAPIGSGDEDVIVGPPTYDSWERITGGSIGGPGLCLINSNEEVGPTCVNDCYSDNFADTYIISGFEVAPRTVTRVSLCEWRSVDECGNISSLLYTGDPPGGSDPPGWFVDVPNYIEPCVVFDVRQGGKIGPANTPVGLYADLLEVS